MTEIALPTSTWRLGDVSMLALLEGRLAQPAPGRLTAVPVGAVSSSPEGTSLVWPAGFTAEEAPGGPVRVLDPHGNVVLQVGDVFSVAGGFGSDGFVMNGYPERIGG